MDYLERAAAVIPSGRQLRWHELEFYAFIHFGMNTFTDSEWGTGEESPQLFNPRDLDANQWVSSLKQAGIKAVILTCKHHDGFCLWPSEYTEHSVKNSPWRGGKGDVVREVSEACKRGGLSFGVYLSPWDRHEPTYGQGDGYNRFFLNQLRELLTNYGEIFCVWFDGACGEGKNGKKQNYAWEDYYALIRELQPNAVINVSGPDVRWCGNEAGHCRAAEWNVVPATLCDCEKVAERSQQQDDSSFSKRYSSTDEDLGSRKVIEQAGELIWYPAEVDVSIRPGWFYHKKQDRQVKSLKKLMNIYYSSVGANASLLLNVPPDKRGLIAAADTRRLGQIGRKLAERFKNSVTVSGVTASSSLEGCEPENILCEKGFWRSADNTEAETITLKLQGEHKIHTVVLRENLATGQQIESFEVYCERRGKQKAVYAGTVVGSRRICIFKKTWADSVTVKITGTRCFATLKQVSIYGE